MVSVVEPFRLTKQHGTQKMKVEVVVQALDTLAFVLVTPEFLGEERLKEVRATLEKIISNISIKDEAKDAYDVGKAVFYDVHAETSASGKEKGLAGSMDRLIGLVRQVVSWLTTYKSTGIKERFFEIFAKIKEIYASCEDFWRVLLNLF
jgi:hypothetical protein